MIQLTNDLIRSAIRRQGFGEPAPGYLHLVGLRSCQRIDAAAITRQEPRRNEYDDVICAFGRFLSVFPATVDPGDRWTLNPGRSAGCAHLANGGPFHYQRGLHKGKPALVQAGKLPLWRDADRDAHQDPSELVKWESGNGVNIHRGGTAPTVGSWSAGCQVIPVAHWADFWKLVKASGQNDFFYWLLDGSRLI